MRAFLLKYTIVFTLVMVSGAMLMSVSQRVQRAERVNMRFDRDIARVEENIRVLKAEWAYLNDPARLEMLVGSLNLVSPEAATLISDMGVLPDKDPNSFIFVPRRSPLHRDISYVPISAVHTPSLSPVSAQFSSSSQYGFPPQNNDGEAQ